MKNEQTQASLLNEVQDKVDELDSRLVEQMETISENKIISMFEEGNTNSLNKYKAHKAVDNLVQRSM